MGSILSRCQKRKGLVLQELSQVGSIEGALIDDSSFEREETEPLAILDDFEKKVLLGKGAFGKVFLVQHKDTGKYYAMKELNKSKIVKAKQAEYAKTERIAMERLNHPFLVKLLYAFQDHENLYLVTEFMQGGELYFHLMKRLKMKKAFVYREDEVMFYMSEILLAIEYMHSKNFIYRDLKPENILLGLDGHIKITDFGLSKILDEEEVKTGTLCGTPDFIAPEIVTDKTYDKSCDWFSFGSLMFELYTGRHPYNIKKGKINPKVYSNPVVMPKELNRDAKDLLKQLLEVDPKKRLGRNGADEIKKHPYFKGVDFELVYKKRYKPPFMPQVQYESDLKYFDSFFTMQDIDNSMINVKTSSEPDSASQFSQFSGNFSGFSYQPNKITTSINTSQLPDSFHQNPTAEDD